MGARLVSVDRETPILPPPDIRDCVPEDDLVHVVIDEPPFETIRR